jgi:hypothetical protein
MGIMAKTYKSHDRAPYAPHRCIVCNVVPSSENPVLDLDKQIDYYGMVYLCYRCTVSVTHQLGFATPEEATALREENATLKEKIGRIPAVTERLVNDIRDISIAASADLLSEPVTVVLVDDKNREQINGGPNKDYFGDDPTVEPSSESSVSEGSDSVPADTGSKRTAKTAVRASAPSN